MPYTRSALAALAIGTLTIGSAALGQARGTPQRSSETPTGLLAAIERGVPGLIRAIEVTEGSNSRLQDLPASP